MSGGADGPGHDGNSLQSCEPVKHLRVLLVGLNSFQINSCKEFISTLILYSLCLIGSK